MQEIQNIDWKTLMKEAFTKIEVKENLEERKSTPKNIPKTSISFDNPYPFPYFDFQEQKKKRKSNQKRAN